MIRQFHLFYTRNLVHMQVLHSIYLFDFLAVGSFNHCCIRRTKFCQPDILGVWHCALSSRLDQLQTCTYSSIIMSEGTVLACEDKQMCLVYLPSIRESQISVVRKTPRPPSESMTVQRSTLNIGSLQTRTYIEPHSYAWGNPGPLIMGGKVIVKIPVLPQFCPNASGGTFVRTGRRPPPGPKLCPKPSDGVKTCKKC